MVPCNHCGSENPLGTMFCRSCGERMEVDLSEIMTSVQETKAGLRDQAILGWARSGLSMAVFLFFSACIVNMIMVPDLPPVAMPAAEPMTIEELLPLENTTQSAATATLAIGSTSTSLVDWRQANALSILTEIGSDIDTIRAWQRQLIVTQSNSGSFSGDDVIGSTALACLALQALPGDPELDAAAAQGREFLINQTRRVLSSSDQRRTILWGMALWENGQLDSEGRSTLQSIAGASDPLWGALLLPLFSTSPRSQNIPMLLRNLKNMPLWLHYLDLFSSEPLITSIANSTFDPANVIELNALERWVWSQMA